MKALSSTLLGLLLLAGCDASTSEPAAHDLVVTFGDGSGPGGAALYGLVPGNEPTLLAELAGEDLYWPSCAGPGGAVVMQSSRSSVQSARTVWVYDDGSLRPAPPFPNGPLGSPTELHGELGPQPWAPDGRRFVLSTVEWCASAIGCREGDLSIVDLDAQSVTPLTTGDPFDARPMWDPSGARIAFMSDRAGEWTLFTIQTDGTQLREIVPLDRDTFQVVSWGPGPDQVTVSRIGDVAAPHTTLLATVNLSTGRIDDLATDASSSFLEWQRGGRFYVSTVRTDSLSPPPEYDPVYNVTVHDMTTNESKVVLSRPGRGGLIDGPVATWCTP